MANLTTESFPVVRGGPDLLSTPVLKDALATYHGSLLSIAGPNAAADNGYAVLNAQTAGYIPLGRTTKTVTGDTDPSPGKRAQVVMHDRIERLAVTGVDGVNDNGKAVYFSDDNVATLTRPSNKALPGGMVLEHHSSTTCEVLVFGAATLAAMAVGGGERQLLFLGSIDCDSITAADVRTGIPMQFHGEIKSVFAMVDVAITGAGGTALLNLEIGGTNVTGGVVTVSTAAGGTKGTKLDGTAVTGANVFHEGDALDIEAATVTDMTAGRVDMFAVVERKFGV